MSSTRVEGRPPPPLLSTCWHLVNRMSSFLKAVDQDTRLVPRQIHHRLPGKGQSIAYGAITEDSGYGWHWYQDRARVVGPSHDHRDVPGCSRPMCLHEQDSQRRQVPQSCARTRPMLRNPPHSAAPRPLHVCCVLVCSGARAAPTWLCDEQERSQ